MRRPLALTAFAAAALLSLAACSTGSAEGDATASASPTPVASAPATPTPDPTPSATPATLPATIIIGAEATDIVTADGTVLASLNYQSDGDAAVAVNLLGEPTAESVAQETLHNLSADLTTWDGFTIAVNRPDADSALPPGPYSSAFLVRARGPMATNNVAITDVNGIQTGQDFESTAAGKPADQVQYDESFGINSVTLDLPSSFPGVVPDYGMPMTYGAIGFTGPESGIIETILAPTYLYSVV
jgi:hypothetical protein